MDMLNTIDIPGISPYVQCMATSHHRRNTKGHDMNWTLRIRKIGKTTDVTLTHANAVDLMDSFGMLQSANAVEAEVTTLDGEQLIYWDDTNNKTTVELMCSK